MNNQADARTARDLGDIDVNSVGALAAVMMVAAVLPSLLYMAPTIVGELVEQRGFTPQQAGWIMVAESAGMALAAVPATWWMPRISWRVALRVSLLLIALANVASALAPNFSTLIVARSFASLGQGSATVLCLAVIGMTQKTERNYGFWTASQLLFAAAGLLAAPYFLPKFGLSGFFLGLAVIMTALTLVAVRFPIRPRMAAEARFSGPLHPAALMLLVGVFLYYVSNAAVWTYAERIGNSFGFTAAALAQRLAFASTFGIIGAVLASVIGDRLGRTAPLAAAIALAVAAIFAMITPGSLLIFTIGACAFTFTQTFSLPYFLAVAAGLEKSPRLIVFSNFMIGGGITAGPAIVAVTLGTPPNYFAAAYSGIIAMVACFVFTVPAALKAKRDAS